MKARKTAGVIEVQRYERGTVQAWPPAVQFLVDGEALRVWNEPQQTWVGVNDGDYVRIDNEILRVTAGFGSATWTVTRGVLGSTAAAHAIMPDIAMASSRSSNSTNAISAVTAGTR